jgi:hypothetical protein
MLVVRGGIISKFSGAQGETATLGFDTKSSKNTKNKKICQFENEIDVTHCDTMRHCYTSVTPKVFKFIGPSKDGQRHGRGTYLFFLVRQIAKGWGVPPEFFNFNSDLF